MSGEGENGKHQQEIFLESLPHTKYLPKDFIDYHIFLTWVRYHDAHFTGRETDD